jgi:hypothetical protein
MWNYVIDIDIDIDIERLFKLCFKKLDKYKITHPNLYKLWGTYFKLKREQFEQNLLHFDTMINNLETNMSPDLSDDNIYFIYIFMRSQEIMRDI